MNHFMRFFLLIGIVFSLCMSTACSRNSDVAKAKELLPKPRTLSPEVAEIFKIAEKILDSDDPDHQVSRRDGSKLLARVRAKYGDTADNVRLFEQKVKELDAAKLEPLNKESAFGMLLVQSADEGAPLDAIRQAEASSSPVVRAVGPFVLGNLQFAAEKFDDAKSSFERSVALIKTSPESPLKNNLVNRIVTTCSMKESFYPVIMKSEDCVPKKGFRQIPAFAFSTVWCKLHQADLDAGRFNEAFKRAETETEDRAKADYVKAVIKAQMKRGQFDDVPKTIDRFFPPGAPKKTVAADEAAIFGRFDGRDLCLETWAIGCMQHGRIGEVQTIFGNIEELKRKNAVLKKLAGVLIGKDVKAGVMYGLLPDTVLGGDTLDETIPKPNYSDSDAELLAFCRMYEEAADSQPYGFAKIGQKASAADLMYHLGLKKESEELYKKTFDEVLAMKPEAGSDVRFEGARPILSLRIREGEFDAVSEMLKKFAENGVEIPTIDRIELLAAMGKYDEAIAMADSDPDKSDRALYYRNIGRAMLTADRKEDARKLFAKLPDDLGYMTNETIYPMVQAGMTDEAMKKVRQIENPENRCRSFAMIAAQQKMEGKMKDAEKTYLEAAKCVEQIDPKLEGNRQVSMNPILSGLLLGPEELEKIKSLMSPK